MKQHLGTSLALGLFVTRDPAAPLALVRAYVGGLEVFKGVPSKDTLGGIRPTGYECLDFGNSPELKGVYTIDGGWNLDELAALLFPADLEASGPWPMVSEIAKARISRRWR